MAPPVELLTVSQICEWLGITRARFYELLEDGLWPAPAERGPPPRWRVQRY